jgi:hypothetical protein
MKEEEEIRTWATYIGLQSKASKNSVELCRDSVLLPVAMLTEPQLALQTMCSTLISVTD